MQTPFTGPDAAEFTTFMRAYQNMVFSTAARLSGNDAQAEDIAQEVFLRAYEHFSQLRGNSAGGWLKTVTTHLTLNYLTRHRRRRRLFSELEAAPAADDSAAPEFECAAADGWFAEVGGERLRVLVDGALRRLPEHQRVPLVLYHFEDLSYQEISERLRVSLAKVKTDIRRARTALLPVLKSAGIVRDIL